MEWPSGLCPSSQGLHQPTKGGSAQVLTGGNSTGEENRCVWIAGRERLRDFEDGEIQPVHSDAQPPLHATDERPLQEMGEPRSDAGPSVRLVQLVPETHDHQNDTRRCGWIGN